MEAPNAYAIEVVDDSTFTISYEQSAAYGTPASLGATLSAIYPRHLLEGLDPEQFWDWGFWTQPVGNGPYRYASHEPGTMISLEANPEDLDDARLAALAVAGVDRLSIGIQSLDEWRLRRWKVTRDSRFTVRSCSTR